MTARDRTPEPAPDLAGERFHLTGADEGVVIHLRNKRRTDVAAFDASRIVLFVHGATYPAETAFDFELPGGAWLDIAAAQGFDAYCVDIRGYGRSSRPASMDEAPQQGEPFADTADAVRDVGTAVDFILARCGARRLNLVGWSWGTVIMASFAIARPDQVERLVLHAPLYRRRAAGQDTGPISGTGTYRTVEREAARERGIRGIPVHRVEEISPRAWFDRWFDATLALDPNAAALNPPVVRAPNGVVRDAARWIAESRPPYDASLIRTPTLIVVGEWDRDTPTYMAVELFEALSATPHKRLVMLGDGTHAMILEKNRLQVIDEVQRFLLANDRLG